MIRFITWHFWFNAKPAPLSLPSRTMLLTYVILLVAGFAFLMFKRSGGTFNNKFWSGVADFCVTNVILGCLLLFFSLEYIPVFESRFWYIIWFIGMGYWGYNLFQRQKKTKIKKEQENKTQEFKKYIPK